MKYKKVKYIENNWIDFEYGKGVVADLISVTENTALVKAEGGSSQIAFLSQLRYLNNKEVK